MKSWAWLMAAATAEVGWVSGIKAANGPWAWAATLACLLASFGLALAAARTLPAATVYVVFVGLGAAGTALADITLFDATLHPAALACLALLLAGVIGLKLSSPQRPR